MNKNCLNTNKDTFLDLNKNFPNMYEHILKNREKESKGSLSKLESFYKRNIEDSILNRNNIGLTFLIIKESAVLNEKILLNSLNDYLNNIGYSSSIFSEENRNYLSIEWQSIVFAEDGKYNSGLLKRLYKEHGLCDIQAAKDIEKYTHSNILPLIIDADNSGQEDMSIKLPKKLTSLPCKKILSNIFRKNDILFSMNISNPKEIHLAWNRKLTKADDTCEFSLIEYEDFKRNAKKKMFQLNSVISNIDRFYFISNNEKRPAYIEKRVAAIISQCTNFRNFYLDDFDLDNLNSISEIDNNERYMEICAKHRIGNKEFEEDFLWLKTSFLKTIQEIYFTSILSAINTSLDIGLIILLIISIFISFNIFVGSVVLIVLKVFFELIVSIVNI